MEVGLTERLDSFVRGHGDRQLAAIPFAIFLVSIVILGIVFASSGAPVKLGMEFEGGTLISVSSQETAASLEHEYADYPIVDARQAGARVIMQFGPMDGD
ncbi:MAG: preprotein translocase subunit SecF, partial [Methanosarcinaceae archaeon]|nr:preprotein translocase subunit SecF [Methanosarcinaceae archaeon]